MILDGKTRQRNHRLMKQANKLKRKILVKTEKDEKAGHRDGITYLIASDEEQTRSHLGVCVSALAATAKRGNLVIEPTERRESEAFAACQSVFADL